MKKKLGLLVSFLLLLGAVAGPSLVSAEMDPLASPTPKPTERVTAPVISGVNPEVELSEGNQGVIIPSDILSGNPGFQLCLLDKNGLFQKQLTHRGDLNSSYFFTPDGKEIIIESRPDEDDPWGIYIINIDGSNLRHLAYLDDFLSEWYADIPRY